MLRKLQKYLAKSPMNVIPSLLSPYRPITLEETMAHAALLKRRDKKYVLPVSYLSLILTELQAHYQILDINGRRDFEYQSSYFDTQDLSLYHAHHSGISPRVKFRVREYKDSSQRYFEAKIRSNKGVTSKDRSLLESNNDISGFLRIFSKRYLPTSLPHAFSSMMQINYKRITLVSIALQERVTIDFDLHFSTSTSQFSLTDRIIVEVKTNGKDVSPAGLFLRKIGIRPGSVSKYCMGIFHLYPNVKKNLFKYRLHVVNSQLKKYRSA